MARRKTTNQTDARRRRRRRSRRARSQEEVEAAFLEYSMSVIVSARAARRARRPEAGAPPHPLGDARREPAPRPPVREVRARRRRRDGQLPPARRHRDLRRARAHGPAVLAHRAADRQARQLRLARPIRRPRRATPSAGCRRSRWSCSPASTRAPSTSSPTTTASRSEPVVLPARFPNLLVNGSAGHRGRHGHQHPAAQPRRGVQRGGEADRQARRHAVGADAHREGPRLPDRRPHHGRRRDQGRVPHRARHGPRARRARDRGAAARGGQAIVAHRGAVPDERRRDRRQARRAGRARGRSTASATSATSRGRARPAS